MRELGSEAGIEILHNMKWRRLALIGGCAASLAVLFSGMPAQAASLSVEPSGGTFTVGSTLDVSLFLDTEADTINALSVNVSFPPELMQLVSPSVGANSVIQVWTAQPSFNNQAGTLSLVGGIPNGLKTSHGLIASLAFRIRGVGTSVVKFTDGSRVLRHDGHGTNVLSDFSSGVFELVLPPPAGPVVSSETHTDQSRWYPGTNAVLHWESLLRSEGYSYILTSDPGDIPDDTPEGIKTSVTYRELSSGVHYFHVKALRDGEWGGTTHFAVKVDNLAPAEFPIEVIPSARTTRSQPIIQFSTTDSDSGLSHYEIKLIPLNPGVAGASGNELTSDPLFIEVTSPYVPPPLELGSYHVVVRVYDNAGNYREATERLKIVKQLFRVIDEKGLEIGSVFTVPWFWVWLTILVFLAGLGYASWTVRRWHYRVEHQKIRRELPDHLQQQLDELKAYHNRYGKLVWVLAAALSLWWANGTQAQGIAPSPPTVEVVSRSISNEEIFYIGGRVESEGTVVSVFLQNAESGETRGFSVGTNERREWFYRHDGFLPAGTYLLWTQARFGDLQSPPSPQVQMKVETTALQFGASRLSFEVLYLVLLLVVSLVMLTLISYIVFHSRHARLKHRDLMKEIREAEESVRRGFAVLRRDIEAELSVIQRARLNKSLGAEEHKREEQLIKDLAETEKYISKEVWDIDQAERNTPN